jgi:cobalt-precorrin-5B (C1)-methyltransferase
MELLGMHAALQGAKPLLLHQIMQATTTDDALDYLIRADLKDAVMRTLTEKMLEHLNARVREKMRIEIIVFSNRYGILSVSEGAYDLLKRIQAEDKT